MSESRSETGLAPLAAASAHTSYADAPEEVRERVVDLVADVVATAALGSGRDEIRLLTDEMSASGSSGSATVIGSRAGWPAATASFLNGSAVATDQLQDGHREGRGHPASHVVPAVLAVAEERDASGDDALSAVLAGYEVGVRLGRAMGGTNPGVHDIGTWGSVGAAAAVARLVRPGDDAASASAIELAQSAVLLTDAATIFSGRTGGHAFLGASVQLGLTLGTAAASGLAPMPGSLERHFGPTAARDLDPTPLASWNAYEVLGGYVKQHPTCAHLHGVNDAVADLPPIDVAHIVEIEVRTFAAAAAFDAIADTELAARFSVPTSVAVALAHGSLDETTLTAANVAASRDLASRVHVIHDPDLDAGYPAGRPARVAARLADGSEVTASADRPRGDADRAFTRRQLREKALRLLTHRFGCVHARRILDAIHALPFGGTPRELGLALRAAALRPGERR